MPIFDKLKSIFIEPDLDGQNPSASTASNKTSETPVNQPIIISTSKSTGDVQMAGQSADKFLEILSQVLEKNNQEGFDYLEYKKAVQSIAKLQNLDEPTQFRTAYAAAQAMNVQPQNLINSAKSYLSVLSQEQQNFNNSASQYLNSQVSQKQGLSDQINQSIKQKQDQIEQLKKELNEAQTKMQGLRTEVENAKLKVDQNKANFSSSYQTVVDQIQQDIQKMEQYLK